MKQRIIITSEELKRRAVSLISALPSGIPYEITIKEYRSTRSGEQNRLLWAMLHDISKQVVWHGMKLTDENWKDIFSASLKKQTAVPGLDRDFVILGTRTSKMTVAEMAQLIELMTAFGIQNDVKFSAPAWMEEQ